MRHTIGALSGVLALALACRAEACRAARVDAAGVLRWRDDASEVALLGVNYYAPFSVDFAELSRLGLDHRQVIEDDVAHVRRLGLGCVRVHCFDREFSDADGNLLDNRHVELLDVLIDACRRSGIYAVLTPIAWWGGSYAPDSKRGFSERYPMHQMTTDPQAWAAQARFLRQFAEHVNRFTGTRYADDPAVLAFECINEPLYPKGTPDSVVTAYIDTLADALRASGTAKPIYYNSWAGRNAAAGAARIDGVTGSNYPTGLASGRALKGPQLFRSRGSSLRPDAAIASKSRMIYEFDAADVPGSHMYPSMAKFFRSEGVQVAAQFQYDPLPLAAVNCNWMTHHLSLVYTPGKAISLAIAAEVFARVPRGTPFGTLPEAAVFPPFRSSGESDLSEMVTDAAYLNSNATDTPPPKPEALTRVWGCGRSPVVGYEGSGAYFLDRAAPGVWRLQLYPDVFTVADPYSGSDAVKVHVLPGRRALSLRLPDMGASFAVRAFNGRSADAPLAEAANGAFTVPPGDYLLSRGGGLPGEDVLLRAASLAPRYVAPTAGAGLAPLLRAEVPPQWRAGRDLALRAEAALATNVAARLVSSSGAVLEVPLLPVGGYAYAGVVPGAALTPGAWRVTFAASGAAGVAQVPDAATLDAEWFPDAGSAVPLIRMPGGADAPAGLETVGHGVATAAVTVVAGRSAGSRALRLRVDGAGTGTSAAGYTVPFQGFGATLEMAHAGLRVVARGGAEGARVEVGFRQRSGTGLGCNLDVGSEWREAVVPAADLIPLWGLTSADAFRWQDVGLVSVLTGAWLLKRDGLDRQTADLAALEWVRLERGFRLTATDGSTPWRLVDADAWLRVNVWPATTRRWRVSDDAGRPAVRLGVETFAGESDCVSARAACDGAAFARLWEADGARAVLQVRVRAASPHTTAFELALIEAGGVPWGTVVPLTTGWRTIRIPVGSLKLFTQWGKEYAALAGPHLRLSRLDQVNVCFGRWLFGENADKPHAVEIAEIGVTAE
jgi:hypothetical protein